MKHPLSHRIRPLNTHRKHVGLSLLLLKEAHSTNSVLLDDHELLSQKGLVVLADRQTAGRGRKNRTWESGSNRHLFASAVLHPVLPQRLFPAITLLAGLSVFRALSALDIDGLSMKWPNDVLIQGKKVCGILCESKKVGDTLFMVLGIGLNIEGDASQFSCELRDKVTTIHHETGKAVSRDILLEQILSELDMVITNAYDGKTASLFAEWERCSSSLGRKVRFEHEGMVMQGSISGLASSGTLLVKRDNAEVTEVLSGEIIYL